MGNIMKMKPVVIALFALVLLGSGAGCSEEKKEGGPGMVEKVTTETAKEMTERLQTPLDKAKAAQTMGEERTEAMDKALEKQ